MHVVTRAASNRFHEKSAPHLSRPTFSSAEGEAPQTRCGFRRQDKERKSQAGRTELIVFSTSQNARNADSLPSSSA